jgi:hypothetical protein
MASIQSNTYLGNISIFLLGRCLSLHNRYIHVARRVWRYQRDIQTSNWFLPRFLVVFVLLDLWFYMYVLLIVVCPFVLFLLAIVLSVLLRYTDSEYPFDIFKLFLPHVYIDCVMINIYQEEKWKYCPNMCYFELMPLYCCRRTDNTMAKRKSTKGQTTINKTYI